MFRRRSFTVVLVGIVLTLSVPLPAQVAGSTEKVLIRASKPYTSLVARIQSLGGRVTYQYKYVDAIAAELPLTGLPALRDLIGTAAMTKDLEIRLPEQTVDTAAAKPLPAAAGPADVLADGVEALSGEAVSSLAGSLPQAYSLNAGIANVAALHASNIRGQGIVVAVIDSGIRPGFPHLTLDGSVVGCENFVPDALGCSNAANNGHGTFVSGMISANVVFTFGATTALRNAVLAHCPACFSNPPTNTAIPMIGTAPAASIYALRVFGPTGGAPTSRILAAMDRAIELREAYDANPATGANISIVNMSLGGPTIFAGRDLFDRMTTALLEHDIVPVVAAGNAGPSSLTVGSPATAIGALTVGAAGLAHNERILRDLQFGLGIGALYRPFTGHQTAFFSSRGPNADGRPDPDVVINGFASFGQGFSTTSGGITIGSGTSYATPSVAGVAALLRQAHPSATARQIRNAIIASANPNVLSDGSTEIDQGAGYVDGVAASSLLAAGTVPDSLPDPPNVTQNVNVNVQQNTFLEAVSGPFLDSASNLKPGQRHEILYKVTPNTRQVVVTLSNFAAALPPAQQNQLFGDDILLSMHTAKTSDLGDGGDYRMFVFTTGGTFVVNNPEEGLLRVTVSGDWTNAGTISSDISIFSTSEAIPQSSKQGEVADQQILAFPVTIPSGVSNAEFRLSWRENWSRYPTADLDLYLVSPGGGVNLNGATYASPEVTRVSNPAAGQWTIIVVGFEIHTATDRFDLRVTLDGKVVKVN
jgi:subtilisin family serine protease